MSDFKHSLKKLKSLAFLPVEDIVPTFLEIIANFSEDAKDYLKYFDEVYVQGKSLLRQNNIFKFDGLLYGPKLWSVFDNNELGIPRTSNNAEAWHN